MAARARAGEDLVSRARRLFVFVFLDLDLHFLLHLDLQPLSAFRGEGIKNARHLSYFLSPVRLVLQDAA